MWEEKQRMFAPCRKLDGDGKAWSCFLAEDRAQLLGIDQKHTAGQRGGGTTSLEGGRGLRKKQKGEEFACTWKKEKRKVRVELMLNGSYFPGEGRQKGHLLRAEEQKAGEGANLVNCLGGGRGSQAKTQRKANQQCRGPGRQPVQPLWW